MLLVKLINKVEKMPHLKHIANNIFLKSVNALKKIGINTSVRFVVSLLKC